MESFIIYLVIALFAIVSGIKNYKKEKAKNKERAKEILSQPIPTIKPFQKKESQNPSPVTTVLKEDTKRKIVHKEDNDNHPQYSLNDTSTSNNNTQSKNIYNNKDIDNILARIKDYSDVNEKEAFFVESDENIYKNNQEEKSFDIELNNPEDYRRAFIHSLIFERKY